MTAMDAYPSIIFPVSNNVSPFAAELDVLASATESTQPPSRSIPLSNESRVRVEGS